MLAKGSVICKARVQCSLTSVAQNHQQSNWICVCILYFECVFLYFACLIFSVFCMCSKVSESNWVAAAVRSVVYIQFDRTALQCIFLHSSAMCIKKIFEVCAKKLGDSKGECQILLCGFCP